MFVEESKYFIRLQIVPMAAKISISWYICKGNLSFLNFYRIMERESQEAQVFCPLFSRIKDIALTLCALILTKRNHAELYFFTEKWLLGKIALGKPSSPLIWFLNDRNLHHERGNEKEIIFHLFISGYCAHKIKLLLHG